MTPRPLVGITAFSSSFIEPPHLPIFGLSRRYVSAIEAAGGAPLIVPPGLDESALRTVFDRLDGVLLPGGGDIDPACYGEAPHPAVYGVSPERDRGEMAIARWAVDAQKPVMAICRGIQVLNVALGGTLVQDIPSQWPNPLLHMFDTTQVERNFMAHAVDIEPGTRLREVIGADRATVNSWYHQSVKHIASGLSVAARAPDGVIEAVELPGHRFALGVQWHPEWLTDQQPEMKRLFESLVQAAA